MNKKNTLFNDAWGYVLELIQKGLLLKDMRLPTDHEIAANVQGSYSTVRLVMTEMEHVGFIRRIRGSGTYITEQAAKLLKEALQKKLVFFHPLNLGNLRSNYNQWISSELKAEAAKHDWKVMTFQVSSHREFLDSMASMPFSADAVVYLPVSEPFDLSQVAEMGKIENPFFIIDFDLPNLSICNITTDNWQGGVMAAKLLLSQNHHRIGTLICEPRINQCSARIQGFREALGVLGIEPIEIDCEIKMDDDRYEKTYQTMMRALSKGLDITALFAISDVGAIAAVNALKEFGLNVPGDISVIGFDGLEIGQRQNPPLTTLKQPISGIIATIFRRLQEKDESEASYILLPPELIPGGSVRSLKYGNSVYEIKDMLMENAGGK